VSAIDPGELKNNREDVPQNRFGWGDQSIGRNLISEVNA